MTTCALWNRQRGFTLIELLIVMVIVAILAAIAYPSYLSSIRKGRRADAADAATAVMQAQERWRANNPLYTTTFASLNTASTSAGGYYSLEISGATGGGYTLTIAAVSGKSQANDTGCTSMTVTVAGGSPTYAPAGCWSK